jgi:hypothetical protein
MYHADHQNKKSQVGVQVKYGVEIPRNTKHAYELDAMNGNSY